MIRATLVLSSLAVAAGIASAVAAPDQPRRIHAGADSATLTYVEKLGREVYLQDEYLGCAADPTIIVFEDHSASCASRDAGQHLRILGQISKYQRDAK